MSERIGVYICHCGTNISHTVDTSAVAEFARALPDVVVVREYKYMCSDPGQELIRKDIAAERLTRVVVSSCSPLMHEETFRTVCEDAGLNRFLFQMSNIREQCSWVHEDRAAATAKAKQLVAAAVRRVVHHRPMTRREVPVRPEAIVIGGGIAGIEAALRLADSGKKVYLVEREPSIGGHMARFDKTFPTLDCAACILTPKMVQVGQHPNIEILSYSEVEEVSGHVGDFKVKVLRKARYVDEEKCTGCGQCTDQCHIERPSEFDEGLSTRKAIYRSFPQAVPNAFVIDKKMAPCSAACPIHTRVAGYVTLIGQWKFDQALEIIKEHNPFPSICGRVCHRPCEKECTRNRLDQPLANAYLKRFAGDLELRLAGKRPVRRPSSRPEKVAVVGAGPAGLTCAYDLARQGYQVRIFEALPIPGGMMAVGIPAFRLPRSILNVEIDAVRDLGVEIIPNTLVGRDVSIEQLFADGYQAVFLGVGAWTSRRLNVPGEDLDGVVHAINFLKAVNLGVPTTVGKKVIVIGGGNAALDTARTAVRLGAEEVSIFYRRGKIEMPAEPKWEIDETVAEGVRLELLVAPRRVIGQNGRVTALECIRMALGPPDASGRPQPVPIPKSEFTVPVDTILPAIGQEVNREMTPAGLEYTSYGTLRVDPVTLETNRPGVFSGGDAVLGPATLIEAIAAGKEAAISIDRSIRGVDLSEGRQTSPRMAPPISVEGIPPIATVEMPKRSMAQRKGNFDEVELGYTEEMAVREAHRCLSCGGCAECRECERKCDPKAINHLMTDSHRELQVGTVVIATGFSLFDAGQMPRYGYGRYKNVFSALEFERLCHAGGPTGGRILTREGKPPASVAILHCIGSRDENHLRYCSRVCCMYSLKFAHLVKEKTGAEVYNLYIDVRASGKGYEEFYKRVLGEDVQFIRGKAAEVTDVAESPEERGKLMVVCEDTLLGLVRRIAVDMVILSSGLRPAEGAEKVAHAFALSCARGEFFLERHPKLAPVDTASDGIFLAGACQGPKDIPDSVAQGGAAAAAALVLMDRGRFVLEPVTAEINAELCAGCKMCIANCPYTAIRYDPEQKVSVVTVELCKGCGTCVAGCPSGAARQDNFEDVQIFAEIKGALAPA